MEAEGCCVSRDSGVVRACAVLVTVLLVVSCGPKAAAQFFAFSQPYNAQVFMNPALVGKADYMRVNAIFRNQWMNIKSPYNTVAASYDMRFAPASYHAIGISFLNDMLGVMNRPVIQYPEFHVAYSFSFNPTYDITLRFGLEGGVMMKSVNYNTLIFPDALTPPVEETGLLTGQPIVTDKPYQSRTSVQPDFAVGFDMDWLSLNWGASVHHISSPRFDVRADDNLKIAPIVEAHVSYAYNIYRLYRFKVPLYITPHLIFYQQRRNLRLSAGIAVDYRMVHASLWVRETLLHESHAVALSLAYVGKYFDLGYTYDMSFLPEKMIGGQMSVHEVALTVKFMYRRQNLLRSPFGNSKRYRSRARRR